MTRDMSALWSSACMDWETPEDLIMAAHKFSPIVLDPATAPDNPTRARTFFAPPIRDGLGESWAVEARDGHTWLNHPYGSGGEQWITKLVNEAPELEHATGLHPARTDTAWYRKLVKSANAVVYIAGRLMFRIRCERCLETRRMMGKLGIIEGELPRPGIYASRYFKVGSVSHFLCVDCASVAHAVEGGPLITKPIGPAGFPSMLSYHGCELDRWLEHFSSWGDARVLRPSRFRVDKRQKFLSF